MKVSSFEITLSYSKKPQDQTVKMNNFDSCLGPWLLLISAFCFSVMGCFLKLASDTGIPSTQIVFFRAVFQFTAISTSMLFIHENNDAELSSKQYTILNGNQENEAVPKFTRLIFVPLGRSRRNVRVILLRGVVGGMGFVIYYYSMKSIPLGDAMTLLSLTPINTILLARVVLGEPIRTLQLIATLLSMVGCILIARGANGSSVEDLGPSYNKLGYLTSIIGSFFGASVIVLVRKAGKMGAHTLQLMFSWCIFGILLSILIGTTTYLSPSIASFLHEERWKMPYDIQTEAWWYILGVCSLGSFAHYLMNYAARLTHAGVTSIVRSTDIMWSYILQVTIFHQQPSTATWYGVFLILASLIFVTWEKLSDSMGRKISPVDAQKTPMENDFHKNQGKYGSISDETEPITSTPRLSV